VAVPNLEGELVMSELPAAPKQTLRYRINRQLREMDRKAGKYDHTHRLRALLGDSYDGQNWPHKLMALTGRLYCGNFDVPHAPDLYIRRGPERDEHRRVINPAQSMLDKKLAYSQTFITKDAMTAWDGVKRGEEWRTFDWQDDGHTLRVGWLGDDGRIHDSGIGEYSGELRMFRKWFIWDSWIKYDWFGLRRWLYYKGLHAAVHEKRPFTCQEIPPKNSGGYDHWHCEYPVGFVGMVKRRLGRPITHPGPHIFRAMRWDENGRLLSAMEEA
jgi:hypothetical protein